MDRAIRDAIRRRLPATPPGGMTLVFADDVARGHLAAFDRGKPGERYILADGYAPMRDVLAWRSPRPGAAGSRRRSRCGLARGMAGVGEAVSRVIKQPPLLGKGQLTFLEWQARASNAKARADLGVEFTPLPEGMARTVRWMADSGRI